MSKQLTGFGINPNNNYEIYAEHHEKMVTMGPVYGPMSERTILPSHSWER